MPRSTSPSPKRKHPPGPYGYQANGWQPRKTPRLSPKPWTGMEIAKLRRDWIDGVPAKVIAHEMRRPAGSILRKVHDLQLGRRRALTAEKNVRLSFQMPPEMYLNLGRLATRKRSNRAKLLRDLIKAAIKADEIAQRPPDRGDY